MIRKIKDYLNERPKLKALTIPFFLAYRRMQAKSLNDKINNGKLLDDLSEKSRQNFTRRSKIITASTDNQYIPRVADAGKVKDGWLIMHNGIKVDPFSYYGAGALHMFVENRGVHEPQEERVFMEAIKTIPEGATMIELGSFWSFYSIWFNKTIKNAKNYMVEPDPLNMEYGKINFRANGVKPAAFVQAFVGGASSVNATGQKTVCVDDLVAQYNIPFVDMLHSDIQGFELEMLHGARKTLDAKKVGYAFISTHSNELHQQCEDFLKQYGFVTLASADKTASFSYDGVLAMRAPYYPGIEPIDISKRTAEQAEAMKKL